MKIALINNADKRTGVGRYAFELHGLLEKSDIEIHHYLFNRNTWSLDEVSKDGFTCVKKINKNPIIDNAALMKFDRLPNLLLDIRLAKFIPLGYDLYHITNQNISCLTYFKKLSRKIITVHDLIFYVYSSNLIKKMLSKLVYGGLKKSDFLIAVSEATKNDMIKYLNIPEKKIQVIHLGVSNSFRPLSTSECDKVFIKYELDRNYRYLLHMGNAEPRKNVITLIKSLHKLITEYKVKDVRLLKINKLSKVDESAIMELGLQNYIKVFDSIPEEDLSGFYNIASAFIFPSFYEGFGLPPLEALACGTPVIASDTSSIPEVIGGAGILLNPKDEKGFAQAMFEVLSDNKLGAEMKFKGLKRAKSFTWEKTTAATLEMYQKIV